MGIEGRYLPELLCVHKLDAEIDPTPWGEREEVTFIGDLPGQEPIGGRS